MKLEVINKQVVEKCNITLNLENAREILALKNILDFSERSCLNHFRHPDDFKEEFQLINNLRKFIR